MDRWPHLPGKFPHETNTFTEWQGADGLGAQFGIHYNELQRLGHECYHVDDSGAVLVNKQGHLAVRTPVERIITAPACSNYGDNFHDLIKKEMPKLHAHATNAGKKYFANLKGEERKGKGYTKMGTRYKNWHSKTRDAHKEWSHRYAWSPILMALWIWANTFHHTLNMEAQKQKKKGPTK